MNVLPRSASLRAVVLVAGSLLSPTFAVAQSRGSPADQEACTPDVFRLCSNLIPDEPAITACLETKRAELSPACGKVFGPPAASSSHHRHMRQRTSF